MVRQHFPNRRIRDVAGEVHKQLSGAGFAARLKPGSRVAIGVGSRGITNIAAIVRAVVDYWKSAGTLGRSWFFPVFSWSARSSPTAACRTFRARCGGSCRAPDSLRA